MTKRRYRIAACAVCGHEFTEQADVITCPSCRTVYDLVNAKIDNTNTMVCSIDCKHRTFRFIEGAAGIGQNHHISICPDCGEIHVGGTTPEGYPFNVKFTLSSEEAVTAAGKYLKMLQAEEKGEFKAWWSL